MKNKLLAPYTTSFLTIFLYLHYSKSDIIPAPFYITKKNQCALYPNGWQLIYWPPLKQCFKIFQMGYPCPDTMELNPVLNKMISKKTEIIGECQCPPGTSFYEKTNRCYKLFERGPCNFNEYFGPMLKNTWKGKLKRIGECRKPDICPNNMAFWSKNMKCYNLFTKGPCDNGKLLIINKDGLAECKCENNDILGKYYYNDKKTCYEHFVKGPCKIYGDIFLPDKKCGCMINIPNYHKETKGCFELGSQGPCPIGNIFLIPDNVTQEQINAICQCKEGYILWENKLCYRLYTRGPCNSNEFLIENGKCIRNICKNGYLYFPNKKFCYRIGSKGPCIGNQVVVFDFTVMPSIDGISYNGLCGCSGILTNLDQTCLELNLHTNMNACESTTEFFEINGKCFKLYTRGPCGPGQWLYPINQIDDKLITKKFAKCECRPGYTKPIVNDIIGTTICHRENISLIRWLMQLLWL